MNPILVPLSKFSVLNGHDGISFIDITDPHDPAYCITWYDTEILTAEQYIRTYHADEMENQRMDVLKSISLLENTRLITLQTLAEAWPRVYGEVYAEYREGFAASPQDDVEAPQQALSVTTIPSLADLMIGPTIEAALQSGEQTDLLTDVFMLPGKPALIITALRAWTDPPDSAVSLLASVLTYKLQTTRVTDLDFANFVSWSDAQISRAISLIPEGLLANVTMIDVSHNPQFSSCDLLETLLTRIPSLKRLDVLDTSIDISSLSRLINTRPELFKHLEILLHPAFLQNDKSVIHKQAFSCVVTSRVSDGFHIAYLPVWTPAAVIQSLNDLFVLAKEYSFYCVDTLVIRAVFSGSLRHGNGEAWDHRHVSLVPGSSNAGFIGEGWMFIIHYFPLSLTYGYGFVKVDAERVNSAMSESTLEDSTSVPWKIYDLEEFLEEMGREGRPLPSKAAIETLKQGLMEMSAPPRMPIVGIPYGLMDNSAFEEMVKETTWKKLDVKGEWSTRECLLEIGHRRDEILPLAPHD